MISALDTISLVVGGLSILFLVAAFAYVLGRLHRLPDRGFREADVELLIEFAEDLHQGISYGTGALLYSEAGRDLEDLAERIRPWAREEQ